MSRQIRGAKPELEVRSAPILGGNSPAMTASDWPWTAVMRNTASSPAKPLLRRRVDTERKGRVSRPLTCSRVSFAPGAARGAGWRCNELTSEGSAVAPVQTAKEMLRGRPRGLLAERKPVGAGSAAGKRANRLAHRGAATAAPTLAVPPARALRREHPDSL
jgi:hypothetical protein